MSVNHGGAQAFVTEKFLDGANPEFDSSWIHKKAVSVDNQSFAGIVLNQA